MRQSKLVYPDALKYLKGHFIGVLFYIKDKEMKLL